MEIRPRKKRIFILAAVAAAALSLPAMAGPIFEQDTYFLKYYFTVDWSATSSVANHLNYATWPASEHPRGATPKYLDFDLTTDFQGIRGGCYELLTLGGPSGHTADTEILVRQDNGTWARLSDDLNGTTYADARIFLDDNVFTSQNPTGTISPTKIRIAAYNQYHNTEDFGIRFFRLGNLTVDQCTGDAGKPAVYIDRHEGVHIIRAI
jgi:hypothetical protein